MNPLMNYMKKRTTVQDTVPPADENEVDAEGYLKMTSFGEVDDQAVTEGNVDDTGSHLGDSETTDE